jgi:hypothetical protein
MCYWFWISKYFILKAHERRASRLRAGLNFACTWPAWTMGQCSYLDREDRSHTTYLHQESHPTFGHARSSCQPYLYVGKRSFRVCDSLEMQPEQLSLGQWCSSKTVQMCICYVVRRQSEALAFFSSIKGVLTRNHCRRKQPQSSNTDWINVTGDRTARSSHVNKRCGGLQVATGWPGEVFSKCQWPPSW